VTEGGTVRDRERLIVALAREVAFGDSVVVGVGTPLALAAVLLAREIHGAAVRLLMPAALDPVARNLADYLVSPWSGGGARTRLSRMDILDAITAGEVTLQFVRPAQVDERLRINTELVRTPRGIRHLVGPVALPDLLERVGRVVAYLPRHDPSALVREVDRVTAPRGGGRLARVITPLAVLERAGDSTAVTARSVSVPAAELAALTGFPIDQDGARPIPEPSPGELDLLRRVVDPLGLSGLEDPSGRTTALAALTRAWRTSPHFREATP
jgi:acyl CoA:acetate/3-ketoacid CoA transferase beta subunit